MPARKNTQLQILQRTIEGDVYEAAQLLAQHIKASYPVTDHDGDLSEWLADGSYDGSETIVSLVAEWNGLQRATREAKYQDQKL